MDDESTFNPQTWIMMMAGAGLVRAWSRVFEPDERNSRFGMRLMGYYLLAGTLFFAFSYSERWSGFWYVLLMPFGAYKVFDLAGTAGLIAWMSLLDRWRERRKKVDV